MMKVSPHFSPVPALQGGCLIALAALVFLVAANRRTGISGLLSSGLLAAAKGEALDPIAASFLGAFLLAALAATRLFPATPAAPVHLSPLGHAVAGLLVGFGTRLGNGCTSGHGVCGLSRLSKRGATAVGIFMAVGMAVAALLGRAGRAGPFYEATSGGSSSKWETPLDAWVATPSSVLSIGSIGQQGAWTLGMAALALALLARGFVLGSPQSSSSSSSAAAAPLAVHGAAVVSGALFALGLQRSGMTAPGKVLAFLWVRTDGGWDPSLACVLGAAVGLLTPATLYVLNHQRHAWADPRVPIFTGKTAWEVSRAERVDRRLVVGEAVFGLGWGLSGLCPGPALVSLASGVPKVALCFSPGYVLGYLLAPPVVSVSSGGKKAK